MVIACGARTGLSTSTGAIADASTSDAPLADVLFIDQVAEGAPPLLDAAPDVPPIFDAGPPLPMLALGASSFIVLPDGRVKAWGTNAAGQLGDGTEIASSVPIEVKGLTGPVRAIASGGHTVCVVLTDGAVQCWGYNREGEAAAPIDSVHIHQPTTVPGLVATSVAVAASSGCALRSSGEVACWGAPGEVLGATNLTEPQPTPLSVTGAGPGVSQLCAATTRACVRIADGTAKCWGRGWEGQNGNGLTVNTATPAFVVGLNDARQVAAGTMHTCALHANGGVSCWGAGWEGQLGNGGTPDELQLVPAPVALPKSATDIAAGPSATCAILVDNTVYCWGYMPAGVGDGTSQKSFLSPTKVQGLAPGVIQIALGSSHACVLHASGAVQCWGNNLNGALGDGTTTASLVPVDVLGLP